jgi:stage V sporulation protein G
MEITEVRIFPKEGINNKLRAYATITIDNVFVVRNIKIIEGKSGLFIAMPSRKIKEPCPKCGHKNAIRSKFCNECGSQLPVYTQPVSPNPEAEHDMRQAEHKDIAHPITVQAREYIQKKILDAYEAEKGKPKSL